MTQFDHILNWKLQPGSHTFPGQDGGTCINEAAIVAAGFPYQPIRNVEEMPKCFSRPICRFAMRLNDEASDKQRQRLLPFVTRLACADTEQVEWERETFIRARTGRWISFDEGLEVLASALAIGQQADGLDGADVSTRMSTARSRAKHAMPLPEEPLAALFTS